MTIGPQRYAPTSTGRLRAQQKLLAGILAEITADNSDTELKAAILATNCPACKNAMITSGHVRMCRNCAFEACKAAGVLVGIWGGNDTAS